MQKHTRLQVPRLFSGALAITLYLASISAVAGVLNSSRELVANPVGNARDFAVPNLVDGLVVEMPPLPFDASDISIRLPVSSTKTETLILRRTTVRDASYRLRVQRADGSIQPETPGLERTYAGWVERSLASVAVSGVQNGLLGSIRQTDDTTIWFQPLRDFLPGSPDSLHVVYRGGDSICDGKCGVGDDDTGAISSDVGNPRGGCGSPNLSCVAQVAFDADFEYFSALGSVSAVEDRITATLHVVNHQYVRELSIQHSITDILVRTAEVDPYNSTNATTLSNQLRTEWETNQTAIPRDVAHLVTGRDLNGTTIGIAWVSNICTNFAYSLTQPLYSNSFSCQTDLMAHELGHNWGASHCSCPNSTMYGFATCANTFLGSGSTSIDQISAYRETRSCLDAATVPAPANNTCDNAISIPANGTYVGSNFGATADGAATGCGSSGGGGADVFWQLTLPHAGTVRINTCGADFDTILSVHSACPTGPNNLIACNDDGGIETCASGTPQSAIEFSAAAFENYYIRVASRSDATGNIVLTVTAPSEPANDFCVDAIDIQEGESAIGSLFGATADGESDCGDSSGNPDAWYVYRATCRGTLTATTCGSGDWGGVDSGMDTVLSLHSGCPGMIQNQLACNDDAIITCPGNSGGSLDSSASAIVSAGSETYIRVSHSGARFRSGLFDLQVTFVPELTAPAIRPIADAAIVSVLPYATSVPQLVENCMLPAQWSLVDGPIGAAIETDGTVRWPEPISADSPYLFRIRATNDQGFDDESWFVHVRERCTGTGSLSLYCTADVDGDCRVTISDLTALLASFGADPGSASYHITVDLNHDGVVGLADLANVLSQFGDLCE